MRQDSKHVFWKEIALIEGWYQQRQMVHLFNLGLFAFDIHPVSDDAAKLRRLERTGYIRWVILGKQNAGTFWRAPKKPKVFNH
jgi:hypothetical protein